MAENEDPAPATEAVQEDQQPQAEQAAPKDTSMQPLIEAKDTSMYEVDVDFDLGGTSILASNPGSQDLVATKRNRGPKEPSLLGSNLSQKPAVRPGEGKVATNPSSGRKSRAIVDRYAAEVRETDRNRKLGFLPMQKQIQYAPASLDIARDMRAEMHDLGEAVGGVHNIAKGNGWDNLLYSDKFQKRMQFLHENSRTGQFTEQYGDEGKYEGQFLHGMRHGKGRYEFREEVYDGEWKWDHRHGSGELRCGDGTVITGQWQNGKLNGLAKVLDQKGTTVYEGEFKDGKRHGLGRQLFESGDMYDGGWQNGRLHDRGVYYFTNGDRLYGMWREGIYDGVGVFHYADGSISRREYRDGLLMSVQDYEHATQRFGKTLTRGGMQKHTRDRDFPKEVFLLNSV